MIDSKLLSALLAWNVDPGLVAVFASLREAEQQFRSILCDAIRVLWAILELSFVCKGQDREMAHLP